MSPKYRGGSRSGKDWSDVWLEGRGTQGGRRLSENRGAHRKKSKEKEVLGAEDANATVVEVFQKQCRVRLDADRREGLCSYRRASLFGVAGVKREKDDETRERTPVAVGDRVQVTIDANGTGFSGVVGGVIPRKNSLVRNAPDRNNVLHVLAANVDRVVIVTSAKNPDFSPGVVDRFMIAAHREQIPVILCVNKIDLLQESSAEVGWSVYRQLSDQLSVEIIETCVKTGIGIEELKAKTAQGVTVFCGHSGVGKTSLLSVLLNRAVGRIGEVSESGKGKHTTTSAVLLSSEGEATAEHQMYYIDTPGIREFGLPGLLPEDLISFYPELFSLPCSQRGCSHWPGQTGYDAQACDASRMLRHETYCGIYESLVEIKEERKRR